MRNQFAQTVETVAAQDEKLVLVLGDIGVFSMRNFQQRFPDRFFNIGILEQAMVSIAAGMAQQGLHPVVHSISPFIVERAYEQIKDDLCYQKLGANLVTVGAAYDYVPDGPTHHNYEDFAVLRVLPGMEVVCPGSAAEFDSLFKQTYNNGHPTYFRLSATNSGVSFPPDQIVFGKGIQVKTGNKLLIFVTGPRLKNVLEAVGSDDIDVVYFHTLKPFDAELARERARKVENIICVEEHSVSGGFGSLVAETVGDIPGVTVRRMGIPDRFQTAYGSFEEISHDIRIDTAGIRAEIESCLRGEIINVP